MVKDSLTPETLQKHALPAYKGKRPNPCCRHFKALMLKNFINYRRTPIGSLGEIFLPAVLMFMLCYLRTIYEPLFIGNFDVYQLKKPFYPTTRFNADTGNWSSTNFYNTELGLDLVPFMKHSDYVATVDLDNTTSFYNPMLDPLGPFYFFPSNCYGNKLAYYSPVIAYVATGNQVEEDFRIQLELLFAK